MGQYIGDYMTEMRKIGEVVLQIMGYLYVRHINNSNEKITGIMIGRELHLSYSNMLHTLNYLSKKGFIDIEHIGRDNNYYLTKEGVEFAKACDLICSVWYK